MKVEPFINIAARILFIRKDLCHSQDPDPKVFCLLLISEGSAARNR